MKTKHLLLLGLIVILGSCSSAYRTGQTPDDVYYSPAPAQDTYVRTDNRNDRDSYANNNSTYNSEDMEIRRGIRDSKYRNSVNFDLGYGGYQDYGYYNPYGSYNPYSYHNPYGYSGVYYNPYSYNSNFYISPYYDYYYYPQVYIYPRIGAVNRTITPRKYNLGAYTTNSSSANTSILNHGYRPVNTTTTTAAPVRNITAAPSNNTTPASNNRSSGVGNFIRRVFTPENNNNRVYRSESNNTNNTYNDSSPARTTQSSSSGSSSSSSGSSAPVRTFRK